MPASIFTTEAKDDVDPYRIPYITEIAAFPTTGNNSMPC